MSQRRTSMRRIIALQGKAKAIAEARLSGAEARKAEIIASREMLQRFVESADLTGPLAVLAATQARSYDAREAEAERQRARLAAARMTAETRLKLAERVGETVAREEDAALDRRALERLIEEAVARDGVEKGSIGH